MTTISEQERERRNRQRKLSRILREPEVLKYTGLKKSQIDAMVRDGRFPAPLRLTGGRAKGWLEDEVLEHQLKLIEARDAAEGRHD